MDAGALGAEIVLSGKVTGARSRVEKFNRGYIKHNGEPAETIVDEGQGVAVMKLGTIGVTVRIIPPDAELPDDFQVHEGVDVEEYIVETDEEDLEDLLEGEPDEAAETPEGETVDEAFEPVEDVEVPEEEVEEVPEEEAVDLPDDEGIGDELDELEEDVEAELSEDTAAEADEVMAEFEDEDAEEVEE
jgi:small subunit ribosomal protein S3